MQTSDIIEIIEKIAPPHLAADWDNCKLQVAALERDIKHIALCLDPSPASIKTALSAGADFILSHHPLLMQGRLPNTLDNYHHVLRLLFNANVALYAAHTSLDINPQGPAGWLARELELQNTQVLKVVGEILEGVEAGYGIVGDLKKSISFAELLVCLQKHINIEAATVCGELAKQVKRVAYCTGSGSSLMQKAHDLHADIFITGDVKYHSALESPLCTIDVGHHSLEEEMMQRFSIELASLLPNVRVDFIPSMSPLRLAQAQI